MSRTEDFITFEEFAERLAYQMIFNIYQEENTRLTTRSILSELSFAAPGTPHNPLPQSSGAEPRRREIETLKSM